MDSSIVWAAVGAAGSEVVRAVWDQITKRRDRLDDRRSARDEEQRTELRRAYVEFFTAQSKYLDEAAALLAIERALFSQKGDAEDAARSVGGDEVDVRQARNAAGHPDLVEKARKGIDAVLQLSTVASEKAKIVVLLEDDTTLVDAVLAIDRATLLMPTHPEVYDQIQEGIKREHATLSALLDKVKGSFAPRNWYDERGEPRRQTMALAEAKKQ